MINHSSLRRLILYGTLFYALCVGVIHAQATAHSVVLTITDPDTSSTTAGTATIERFTGTCPATGVPSGGGTALSTTVSVAGTGTFTDTTVTAGNSYCYWVFVKIGGATSPNSNTFLGAINLSVPVLAGVSN